MFDFLNHIPLGFYILGPAINLIISGIAGTILLIKTPNIKTNKIFAIFSYLIVAWSFFYILSLITTDQPLSLFFLRTCMPPVCFMGIVYFHFAINLLEINKYKLFIKINYILSFAISCSVYTDYYAYGSISYPVIKHWLKAGPLLTFSIIHFFILLSFAFYLLLKAIKNNESIKKVQYLYVFIGTLIGFLMGFTNYLLWYGVKNYSILNMFTSLCFTILPYAILRYKLIDVNYIAKKIVAYLIYLVLTSSSIFILFGLFFNLQTFQIFLFIFIIFGLIPFVYTFIVNLIDSFVLKDFKVRLQSLTDFFILDDGYKYQANTVKSWAEHFVQKLHNITNVSKTLIFCITREDGCYTLLAQAGNETKLTNYKIAETDPLVQYLKKTKGYIVKSNLNPSDKKHTEILKIMNDLEFELIFSFFAENELIGILALGDRKGTNLFHEKEIEKLAYLVKALEHSLSNVYFSEDMEELKNIANRITEFTDKQEVSSYIISSIMRLFNSSNVALYLHDSVQKTYYCAAQKGLSNSDVLNHIPDNNYLFKFLRSSEKALSYQDLKNKIGDFALDDMKSSLELMKQLNSEKIIPLVSSIFLGFLVIGKKQTGTPYSSNDAIMYSQLSIIFSIKIHGIIIKEESEIDSLTRAYARKSIDNWIPKLIAWAKRDKTPLTFLFFDIDNFKIINDLRGHDIGDAVLIELVQCIKKESRSKDMLIRLGGDEFVYILWDIKNDTEIKNILNRIQAELKKGTETYNVTLSIGQVIYLPNREIEHEINNIKSIQKTIFKIGDDSSYFSKKNGRNQLRIGGIVEDKLINEKYKWTLQIITDTTKYYTDFAPYFTKNEITVKESKINNIITIFEETRPDGFLIVIDETTDLTTIKSTIKELKKRSVSSSLNVILKNYALKDELQDLSIDCFFNMDEPKQLDFWAKSLAKNLEE